MSEECIPLMAVVDGFSSGIFCIGKQIMRNKQRENKQNNCLAEIYFFVTSLFSVIVNPPWLLFKMLKELQNIKVLCNKHTHAPTDRHTHTSALCVALKVFHHFEHELN
jgi:hypothetical protein